MLKVLISLLADIRSEIRHHMVADDACRIEHVISDETFEAIRNHMLEHN